jgi:regulator of protease activity HflC (stomatin/prohibitin superfamily)
VIDPAFNDFIKEVVPRYEAKAILGKRDEIRATAKQQLGDNLARYGIIVDDIYVSNISFSDEYQAAVEKSQTNQQNVEAERQILAQKGIQAQQALVDAQGKANAAVAKANGDAEANAALTASLTTQLIDYLRWTRWDGKLPTVTGNTSTLFEMQAPAAPAR